MLLLFILFFFNNVSAPPMLQNNGFTTKRNIPLSNTPIPITYTPDSTQRLKDKEQENLRNATPTIVASIRTNNESTQRTPESPPTDQRPLLVQRSNSPVRSPVFESPRQQTSQPITPKLTTQQLQIQSTTQPTLPIQSTSQPQTPHVSQQITQKITTPTAQPNPKIPSNSPVGSNLNPLLNSMTQTSQPPTPKTIIFNAIPTTQNLTNEQFNIIAVAEILTLEHNTSPLPEKGVETNDTSTQNDIFYTYENIKQMLRNIPEPNVQALALAFYNLCSILDSKATDNKSIYLQTTIQIFEEIISAIYPAEILRRTIFAIAKVLNTITFAETNDEEEESIRVDITTIQDLELEEKLKPEKQELQPDIAINKILKLEEVISLTRLNEHFKKPPKFKNICEDIEILLKGILANTEPTWCKYNFEEEVMKNIDVADQASNSMMTSVLCATMYAIAYQESKVSKQTLALIIKVIQNYVDAMKLGKIKKYSMANQRIMLMFQLILASLRPFNQKAPFVSTEFINLHQTMETELLQYILTKNKESKIGFKHVWFLAKRVFKALFCFCCYSQDITSAYPTSILVNRMQSIQEKLNNHLAVTPTTHIDHKNGNIMSIWLSALISGLIMYQLHPGDHTTIFSELTKDSATTIKLLYSTFYLASGITNLITAVTFAYGVVMIASLILGH